ncbi:hypothetical protein J6590_035454 [Homalodisca vitripennis]|nr:hypothetical protein J6590_035454 [Homalodisca vitripennis]
MNIRYAGGLRWVIINPKIPNPLYPDKPQSNTLSSASRPPTVAVSGGAAVQQITRGGAVTAVAPPSHPATPAPAVPPPPSVSAPQWQGTDLTAPETLLLPSECSENSLAALKPIIWQNPILAANARSRIQNNIIEDFYEESPKNLHG